MLKGNLLMSFVNELNDAINNAGQVQQENEKKRISSLVDELIQYIKGKCRTTPQAKRLSGYIYYSRDSDYGFSIFNLLDNLPDCNIRKLNKESNRSNYTYVIRPGITKSRVYKSVLCFDSYDSASYFAEQFEIELQKLGFKEYNVSIEKIKDLYLTCRARRCFFHDSRQYSLETNGYTFVLHLNIQW